MKRIYYILILAIFLVASCDKENSGTSLKSFTAETDSESWTWSVGDVIRVSNGKSTSDYSYDEASGKFVTDTPLEKSGDIQAIYPATSAEFAGDHFQMEIPNEQHASLADIEKRPLYLWKAKDGVFRFKSLFGVVKISLTGSGTALYESDLEEVVFVSTGNPVCGTASISGNGDLTLSSPSQELKIVCPEGTGVRNSVFFMLPAQKYPMGSKLRFTFADGKSFESETIMGIVPRRGMTKAYEIEVTSDFFGPLEEYEDGGTIDDKY